MKNKLYLGIDTSNYTTSLSLVRDGKVFRHVRRLLPVKDGDCGLRQSDAVFLHTKAVPELSKDLFDHADYKPHDLCAVGVSTKPRDADGSYMPCFLAGLSFAGGIADALQLPLYTFSHQAGHLMAAIKSSGAEETFGGDFLSYHVSGGTTEGLLVKPNGITFDVNIVGGSLDASAGQIIDRAGVLAALPFPCGKALDEIARDAKPLKPLCVSMRDGFFSLSGLQNRFEKQYHESKPLAENAAFVFDSIGEALARSVASLREKYGDLPVLFAGGVMCNSRIREKLQQLDRAYFASRELSSDNACGIAYLCEKAYSNT